MAVNFFMEILQVITTFLLIMLNGSLALITTKVSKLPLTLNVLAWGLLSAFLIPILGIDTGIRADNFQSLIMFVLIPILVFEAGLNIHTHLFKPLLATILFSATFGVIIAALIAALLLFYGINHPVGFPIIAALIAGLVISATDPVAVVDQLKEAKAPAKLATLVEGESLFNDATVIVIFTLLISIALGQQSPDITNGLWIFIKVLAGGVLVGTLIAFVGRLLIPLMPASADASSFFSLALAYGTFYVAEHILYVSGVISVLVLALIIKGPLLAKTKERERIQHSWQLFAFIANITVFWLMGLVVSFDIVTDQWHALLVGLVAAFTSRVVSVYLSIWMGKHAFKQALQWSFAPIMVWGGLRGVITIALVLSLPTELPYWWTIQSIAFGVVIFTLVVQAPTNPWLMKKLKLV